MQVHDMPTGKIIVVDGSLGKLECLSIGDYGKARNVKADFLGYTNPINGVANGKCEPLSSKWVMTLSTQYGCEQRCKFCDCWKGKFDGNATFGDFVCQLKAARDVFPEVKYTDRLNIHFARMGEPMLNFDTVLRFSEHIMTGRRGIQGWLGLRVEVIHPVFTTCVPTKVCTEKADDYIRQWIRLKNVLCDGAAGLQLSINSTDEAQRQDMFSGMAASLETLSKLSEGWEDPVGRKYCLNFALADGYTVDGKLLASMFDSEKFMCKITPMHETKAATSKGIVTKNWSNSYVPYQKAEESLKEAGFDVLVFVPSLDEDSNYITCGNAITKGSADDRTRGTAGQ